MTTIEKEEFANAFRHTNYWLIIPIVVMSLLSHLIRAIRWKYLMEPLGYNPSLKNVFSVVMIGYIANSAVPRLGEILKCTFLARYEKLKVGNLVGTIIVERTFDFICFIIFIGITILIQIDIVGKYVEEKIIKIGSSSGMPLWAKTLMIVLIIAAIIFIIKTLFKKFPQNKIISRINLFIKGIGEGFKTIKK